MNWPGLIVFDLDGTLIHSAPDIHAAVGRMLDEFGRSPLTLAAVTKMIGDGTHRLIERALAASSGPPVDEATAHERFMVYYSADPVTLTALYPGVAEAVPRLAAAGFRLAVCTNKPAAASVHILEALGLAGHFEHIMGGDSTPWKKPDPRGIEQLLTELGVAAGDVLVVGDSEIDGATAAAASLKFVLMSYGYHRGALADIPHDALLDSMAELDLALLDRLGSALTASGAAA